jgi:predicted nucleic acid-binding protein
MLVYVDTSAVMKLLVAEAGSDALAEHLELSRTRAGDTLVASSLLRTELHCASNRRPEVVHPDAVADALSVLALVDVEHGDLTTAPPLPGALRSAGAIHLATALRVDARELVAYDQELCSAATTAGIVVRSPR